VKDIEPECEDGNKNPWVPYRSGPVEGSITSTLTTLRESMSDRHINGSDLDCWIQ
jgi:hypothetical protein